MDLKDVAAVSGKSGLFKVVKPTRTGVILETIDAQKKKTIANANSRVSILKEISIYTTTGENSVLLEEVFKTIHKKFGQEIKVTSKSSEKELLDFLEDVVPDYDNERVYLSDIKKLVSWYKILGDFYPELFVEKEKKKAPSEKKEGTEKKATPKKTTAKKPAETDKAKKATPKKKTTSTKAG